MEDVFQKNGNVMEKMIVWMNQMKLMRKETNVFMKQNAQRIQLNVEIRKSVFQLNTVVMVIMIVEIILMKMLNIVKTDRSLYVLPRSSNVTITDVFLNNGNVTVTMTVEMVPMKNWKCVEMPHVLPTNSHVQTDDAFQFIGSAMVIMIVMMELMKTRKDVHQFNALLFNLDVQMVDNVFH